VERAFSAGGIVLPDSAKDKPSRGKIIAIGDGRLLDDGTRVELDHVGATLLGMWVEITVTLASVEGAAVSFDFTVRDAVEEVARGKHNRFIVGIEKTAQRLKAKAAKASG